LADLPIGESDPRQRLLRVSQETRRAKASGESEALALAGALADLTIHGSIALAAKAAIRLRPFNIIVTNIPGPPLPLYFLGAKLLQAYPMVPIYTNQAVGIAVLSYDGKL